MNGMLKRFAQALVALPVAYLLFAISMRFVGPTPEQARALAQLHVPTPAVRGRDGSDAAWLLEFDVPPDRQAELARRTRTYLESKQADYSGRSFGAAPDRADPRSAWPRFAKIDESPGVCDGEHELTCLAQVRAHRHEVDAILAKHARGIQADLDFAANHDGMRYGIQPHLFDEFPKLGYQHRGTLLLFARRFVDGETSPALDALCVDIAGWRRIGGDGDYLIGSMIGAGMVRRDLQLLSEMVAELPQEAQLPATCAIALAPPADYELDLCPAMRTEQGMTEWIAAHMRESARELGESQLSALAVDPNTLVRASAMDKARFCGPVALARARADRKLETAPGWTACSRWRAAADPVGCILAEISNGQLPPYSAARPDQAAQVALMRVVLQAHRLGTAPQDMQASFDSTRTGLGLLRRVSFDGTTGTASIPRYRRDGKSFALRVTAPRSIVSNSRATEEKQ
jgi:hypothetical protein